jgi:4-hydroxybenzoate polyprenyltransferase
MIDLAARLATFIRERFPLGPSLLGAALLALTADRVGGRLLGRADATLDGRSLAAVSLVAALLLILRVVDELGDLDEDRLAWPGRPLARGATRPADVVVLAVVVGLAAVLGVGLAAGGVGAVIGVIAIVVTVALQRDLGLSFLRRRPVLSLVLHQLMVPVWVLAVLALRGLDDLGSPLRWPGPTLLLALCLSLLFELGRKTRHPDDEVAHDESWSQLFGLRGSVVAVIVVAVAGLLSTFVVVHTLALPVWAAVVPGVALLWMIGVALRVPHRRGRLLELSAALASLWVYLPLLVATA